MSAECPVPSGLRLGTRHSALCTGHFMNDVLFFNGRWTTTDERVLGVEDRGFQFGDAVYEVFKFLRKRPILAIDHFRRLDRGLREIDIRNPWNESGFLRTVDELLDRTIFDDGIVYIQVSRGEGERAHFYPDNMPPTALMYTRRFKFPDEVKKELGIRLITAPDLRWKQCQVKSVNLLPNALAKKRAQRKGADEALLVGDGEVREGASSSFFVVRAGRLITHPLDEHILAGVVRDRVIGNSRRGEITTRLQRLFDDLEMSEMSQQRRETTVSDSPPRRR